MLAKIRAVRARKVAEAALVRLLPFMERGNVRLQLRVRRGRVSAPVTYVRALACVRALMVVLCLVGGEGLVAALEAACVGAVTRVREEVAREFGALLEVLGGCFAVFPLADALGAVIYVGGFDVGVERGGVGEGGETEESRGVLPFADAGLGGICGSFGC